MLKDAQMSLHAYLDGELGPDEATAVEALLEQDPDICAQFDAFANQKAQLRDILEVFETRPHDFETARLERLLAAAIQRRCAPHGKAGLGA